ncbi:MAG TPA: hypothetical protein VFD39_12595 [Trueperaceae bacterium]|nr:hypothetical protein [Trueperaceae bacterium]
MYTGILDLHNVLRWAVVVLGVIAIIAALAGSRWTPQQASLGRWFSIALDVQVLIGLVLYFVSPLVQNALQDFGAAMGDSTLRFFALEHGLIMLVAAALVHIGVSRGRKTDNPRQALIFYLLGAAAIAYAIPWDRRLIPGM